MKIFNGKKFAEKILLDLKKRIRREKIKPKLAVILVGDNKASKLYIKLKKRAAGRIGINLALYKFGQKAKEKDIVRKIKDLNKDKSINGIIVQLPLPKKFNQNRIVGMIDLSKDVDGFLKKSGSSPVLPSAIYLVLKSASKFFKGKKILALTNSDIFGFTLKDFLVKKGIKMKYLLRTSSGVKSNLKSADVIISVCGVPGLITGEVIKKGVILIDAGFPADADRESVEQKASFLTPNPGGVGPLTVALLLKNVYLAAKKYGKYS
ncbi:MAG: bifunctional 5,10-methylenetetrahydrofolate dehydrogenase/5,10-methenyltetrahydrofolate cyclohydrolase [Candidatus Pacebacteria bacterium]|nr:bifunctional 5,10-methylenetetrahydrofolate dehydrogenase/5,10-methenyltetrahydrofolate cyclohydrolase [Candidatus Paceibacterota bacterium]